MKKSTKIASLITIAFGCVVILGMKHIPINNSAHQCDTIIITTTEDKHRKAVEQFIHDLASDFEPYNSRGELKSKPHRDTIVRYDGNPFIKK